MKLTKNFTLEEMVHSDTAKRLCIPNNPNEEVKEALLALCENVLQPLRDKLGKPIGINSGYRSKRLNMAVGGSETSQHCKGEAVDLRGDIKKMFEILINTSLPFDQIIWENTWVHVSHRRHGYNRHQILRYHPATKTSKAYYEDIRKTWKDVIK